MAVAFYLWGFLGLLINGASFLALTGNVGVGTSAYLAAGNLLWIGGMVLFGLGAVINHMRSDAVAVPGDIKLEK